MDESELAQLGSLQTHPMTNKAEDENYRYPRKHNTIFTYKEIRPYILQKQTRLAKKLHILVPQMIIDI